MSSRASGSGSTSADNATRQYPPPNHILRHLRLSHYTHGSDNTAVNNASPPAAAAGSPSSAAITATMEVLDDLCDPDGWLRLGAIATLVDSVAGHHSVMEVSPDWVATLHLSTVLSAQAQGPKVAAACVPLRVGRNQVVTETAITDGAETQVARSTCTYARLPRRSDTPRVETAAGEREVHYREEAELDPRPPLDEYLKLNPTPGEPEMLVAMHPRIRNSFGSLQGGASVVIAEVMAKHLAGNRFEDTAWRCTQADVHFLAPARGDNIRVTAEYLRADPGSVTVSVRYVDVGDGDDGGSDGGRLIQVATATVMATTGDAAPQGNG